MKKLNIILLAIASVILMNSCTEISSWDDPTSEEPTPGPKPIIPTDGEVITEGAVDLGLSVKWAACNLGTSACFETGSLYQWGDQRNNCLLNISGTSYDQATQELGEGWQLPTLEQAQELINNCRWTPSTYRGVKGFIVTGSTQNAIFIPDVNNDYWTGTCDVNTNEAYILDIYFSYYSDYSTYMMSTDARYTYHYIRPVYVGL